MLFLYPPRLAASLQRTQCEKPRRNPVGFMVVSTVKIVCNCFFIKVFIKR